MKLKTLYLILCILGIVLPYWQFLPWGAQNGLHMPLFFHELFANRVSAFFGMDVLVWASPDSMDRAWWCRHKLRRMPRRLLSPASAYWPVLRWAAQHTLSHLPFQDLMKVLRMLREALPQSPAKTALSWNAPLSEMCHHRDPRGTAPDVFSIW